MASGSLRNATPALQRLAYGVGGAGVSFEFTYGEGAWLDDLDLRFCFLSKPPPTPPQ